MKKHGTPKRRVKIVRQRPTQALLARIEELESQTTDVWDITKHTQTMLGLLMRRLDGLEARIEADKLRGSVKW